MTIVNIRGYSGSGKSTAVKSIMQLYPKIEPVYTLMLQRPTYYCCSGLEQHNNLCVIGPYDAGESANGCDLILHTTKIQALASAYSSAGWDVLFEGALLSTTNSIVLSDSCRAASAVICLTTDEQQSFNSKIQRSQRAGRSTDKLNQGIVNKKVLEAKIKELEQHHIPVVYSTRENIQACYLSLIKPKTDDHQSVDLHALHVKLENTRGVRAAKKILPAHLFG